MSGRARGLDSATGLRLLGARAALWEALRAALWEALRAALWEDEWRLALRARRACG